MPDHGENSYRGADRLKGCVAIVTEADTGIGRAVAIAFAREGADLVLAHRDEHDNATETARWVAHSGQRVLVLTGDVRDGRYRNELVSRAVSDFGRLDILVNNTAFQWAHGLPDTADATDIENEIRTQSESVFFLSQEAAASMNAGASIILTSLLQAAEHPVAQLRAHASTEHAIANFTTSLAQSLASDGIRVNAVAPGPVWTHRLLTTLSDEQIAHFGNDTLFGRPAQPAEVAPVYVFLASNEAISVSGAILQVAACR